MGSRGPTAPKERAAHGGRHQAVSWPELHAQHRAAVAHHSITEEFPQTLACSPQALLHLLWEPRETAKPALNQPQERRPVLQEEAVCLRAGNPVIRACRSGPWASPTQQRAGCTPTQTGTSEEGTRAHLSSVFPRTLDSDAALLGGGTQWADCRPRPGPLRRCRQRALKAQPHVSRVIDQVALPDSRLWGLLNPMAPACQVETDLK